MIQRLPNTACLWFNEFSSDVLLTLADQLLLSGRLTLADAEHAILDNEAAAIDERDLRDHLGLLCDLHLATRHVERTARRARVVWLSTMKGGAP